MSVPATSKGNDSPKLRDDTTRFLCGAAHRDAEFADSAIREYLIEATRSIPRSPGVSSGAVSREAVAARTRRKVRDSSLPVPALVVLFAASGTLLAGWLPAGTGARVAFRRPWPATPPARGPVVLGSIAGGIALFFVLCKFIEELDASAGYCRPRYEECERESSGGTLATLISSIAVLFADRVELWRNEWKVRVPGHSSYVEALALHPTEEYDEPDDGEAQVIVVSGTSGRGTS